MLVVAKGFALCLISASGGMADTHDACDEHAVMDNRFVATVPDRHGQPWLKLEAQMPQPDAVIALTHLLAATGGVLTAPEGGRLIIIEPPGTGPNSMGTKPDIEPRADFDAQASVSARQ